MRRVRAALTLAALASLTLTACGVGGSSAAGGDKAVATDAPLKGTVTFQTWSLKNDKFTPYFTALIKDFESRHPGTTVTWVDQPGDGYPDKVTSQVTGGSLPDVVNLPPDIAHSVAKVGGLLDLAKNVPTLSKDYVRSGLTAYTYGDLGTAATYGFPWYLGTDISLWNKGMLQRDGLDPANLPKTFDQLLAQAKVMHDRSGGKDYLMSRPPGLSDIVNSGTPLMTPDGKTFAFATPGAAAMLDKYTAAYAAGYLPSDVLTSTYEGNSALFNKQVVAWTTGGGNYIASTQQTNPSLVPQIVPSPALDTAPLYVQGLSVSSKSKNLPLALAFAQFATDNANQAAFVKLAPGYLPGTTAAADDPSYSKSDGTAQGDASVFAYQDMQNAVNFTPPVWTSAMDTYLNQQIALAMTGKESSAQALHNAQDRANQLLNQ
ncbi:ABC transporter substrate-binding protein [Kitasatospora viridis]|uniref:Carbohydrate ABC transporter substrate-binding protein (CUT1 family) n=1 Tax=Kitasatospora viridis TaxID=281105 RepID=A0A561UA93_9ACTN|nr:extracellular solute-binding protein [Kitasatospora viridis]TWF96281.1 carbohydrate ABC transporter substrate-binding protein (CUT1 family) [Kitasatospora viridis]